MQGAFQAGQPATFRGRITYPACRTPVWPPSDWDGAAAARSASLPTVSGKSA